MDYLLPGIFLIIVLSFLGIIVLTDRANRAAEEHGKPILGLKPISLKSFWEYVGKTSFSVLFWWLNFVDVHDAYQGEYKGFDVCIFQGSFNDGKGRATAVHIRGVRNLPKFLLTPLGLEPRISNLLNGAVVEFPSFPLFDDKYSLRGRDEDRLRSLFQPHILKFLQEHEGITVESRGNDLLVLKTNDKAGKENYAAYVDRAIDFIELLKGGQPKPGLSESFVDRGPQENSIEEPLSDVITRFAPAGKKRKFLKAAQLISIATVVIILSATLFRSRSNSDDAKEIFKIVGIVCGFMYFTYLAGRHIFELKGSYSELEDGKPGKLRLLISWASFLFQVTIVLFLGSAILAFISLSSLPSSVQDFAVDKHSNIILLTDYGSSLTIYSPDLKIKKTVDLWGATFKSGARMVLSEDNDKRLYLEDEDCLYLYDMNGELPSFYCEGGQGGWLLTKERVAHFVGSGKVPEDLVLAKRLRRLARPGDVLFYDDGRRGPKDIQAPFTADNGNTYVSRGWLYGIDEFNRRGELIKELRPPPLMRPLVWINETFPFWFIFLFEMAALLFVFRKRDIVRWIKKVLPRIKTL